MTAHNLIPEAWTEPGVAVPQAWIEDADAIAREQAEAVLLISEKRYKRAAHAHADCNAFNLYALGAQLRRAEGDDLAFRIVIRAGARPEVVARHLRRTAPHFDFFAAVEKAAPDEPGNARA